MLEFGLSMRNFWAQNRNFPLNINQIAPYPWSCISIDPIPSHAFISREFLSNGLKRKLIAYKFMHTVFTVDFTIYLKTVCIAIKYNITDVHCTMYIIRYYIYSAQIGFLFSFSIRRFDWYILWYCLISTKAKNYYKIGGMGF